MRKYYKSLFVQLQFNPPPWSDTHISLIKQIMTNIKTLACLDICTTNFFKIVETYASNISYSDILKQVVSPYSFEQIVCFHFGAEKCTN